MTRIVGASVVIVGGGVTGLSTGWWLARAGVDAIILEKGIVGWEASGRNGGGCTHLYSPLAMEEQRLWPQMDQLLGYPTEHEPNRIGVALNEGQLKRQREMAEWNAKRGFKTDLLDAKQLKELVPIVGDNALGGTFSHFGGHANPQRTSQAYAWAFQDLGGRIFQYTTVTDLVVKGDKVVEVVTDRGTFGCDVVVDAAGPQTALIAAMAGVNVPLAHARAEIIVTAPVPQMFRGGIAGNGLYGRQTKRGNLAYGGGPHEWIDPVDLTTPEKPNSPLVRNLARRLAELFPGAAHVPLIRSWAGIVEVTPDGRPILDRLSQPSNLIIATMSSVGFGLSPATGHAVADLAIHGQCTFADLSSLRLSRFDGTPPDWKDRLGWVPSPLRDELGEVVPDQPVEAGSPAT